MKSILSTFFCRFLCSWCLFSLVCSCSWIHLHLTYRRLYKHTSLLGLVYNLLLSFLRKRNLASWIRLSGTWYARRCAILITNNDKELHRRCPRLATGGQQTDYTILWSTSCKWGAPVRLHGQLPSAPPCEWWGSGGWRLAGLQDAAFVGIEPRRRGKNTLVYERNNASSKTYNSQV